MAINYKTLAGISNVQFWDECRKNNAQFENITSAGTKEIFSEKGFEAVKAAGLNILNQFFELSMRVAFQKLDIARATNPLADIGLVERYDTPNGGFVQRIAVGSISPISPKYNNLADGMSVDPFVVRRPKADQRFFTQNFDYQNLITIQDFRVKQIFLDEYGMGAFISGIMQGLETGRTKQEYVNLKEVLNAGLNSTEYPLKSSQIIATQIPQDISTVTESQLLAFTESVMDLMTGMTGQASSSQYNAAGFDTKVDNSDYIMLLRYPVFTRLRTRLRVGAFNPEDLAIPIERIVPVTDFGGIVPYAEAGYETRLYPVYNSFGAETGYFITTANKGTLAEITDSNNNVMGYQATSGTDISSIANVVSKEDAFFKDENAEVVGIVAQRGLLFENKQNPYTVNPIYNPAGLYNNYWANSPANTVAFDYYYNMIVFVSGE